MSQKLEFVLSVAILMGTISQGFAQNPNLPGVTIEEFFNAAIEYSPDLQIASENLNISSARKRAATGQLLPQLSAGANVSDNDFEQLNNSQNFTGERYFPRIDADLIQLATICRSKNKRTYWKTSPRKSTTIS